MSSRVVSILCVDDNLQVGQSLERWFRRLSDFRWLGWVSATAQVEEMVDRLKPDITLMDLDMPGEDPVAVVARLASRQPPMRVVMLSAHLKPHDIERSLKAGAVGYLSKHQGPDAIAAEVMRIADGAVVLSPAAESALRDARPPPA
jgi:DNA-binding NarL/FixJ family response regulator